MSQNYYSPYLKDTSKQYINENYDPVPRYIVAAANYHEELDILLVGSRHWSKAMVNQFKNMNLEARGGEFLQGFIDQYDQFVTREEAKDICIKNGQKLIGEDWGNDLYSENLY